MVGSAAEANKAWKLFIASGLFVGFGDDPSFAPDGLKRGLFNSRHSTAMFAPTSSGNTSKEEDSYHYQHQHQHLHLTIIFI